MSNSPDTKLSTASIISPASLDEWRGSITTFNGFKNTKPAQEFGNITWTEASKLICPNQPPLVTDKKLAFYIVPCLLKNAPLVGYTLEAAKKNGEPLIGKMRSKSHVTSASLLIIDIDGLPEVAFEAGLTEIKADGLTFLAYTTHSHGSPDKPDMRVRVIILLDRPLTIVEYASAWHGFDQHYWLGEAGKADSSGANLYQQQGIRCCHPDRREQSKVWRHNDGVASANILIQLGKSVLTKCVNTLLPNDPDHQNLSSNTQYPQGDANVIAQRCNQIREFRNKKGAGQNEPLWRDCIGVVGYCENGEALCQDWSSGHSGYTQAKTSQKMAYRLKVPPTTCTQFKKSNPSGCQSCLQKCNSPISLGWGEGIKIKEPIDSEDSFDLLKKTQEQYCLININGRLWVLDRSTLNIRTEQETATKLALSNRSDGALLLTRTAKLLSSQVDASKIVKEFFISPQTTCFNGVEFNPVGTSEKTLNLWVGPTISPKSGEWKLIANYFLEVICNNDSDAYNFLIRFLAHALQRPQEKPGIMIILIGGQGTGKGTLARILRRIWSATFLQIHNIDAVTGSFNAALERNFIVFMDEALFVGDRRASDALKSLVTEPIIHINEKHQPARQMQSFHRFFAATNAEHFKNTEHDDRRDFVLRVSESRKSDHAYWKALHNEIVNAGVEAMVHDFLTMDLGNFNVRAKPSTQALIDQKLQSLDPIPRWWHDCLATGEFTEDGKWPDFIRTSTIIDNVIEFTGGKIYRKPTPIDVAKALKKFCPSAYKKQLQNGYDRARGYNIPSLEQARKEFEVYIAGSIQW